MGIKWPPKTYFQKGSFWILFKGCGRMEPILTSFPSLPLLYIWFFSPSPPPPILEPISAPNIFLKSHFPIHTKFPIHRRPQSQPQPLSTLSFLSTHKKVLSMYFPRKKTISSSSLTLPKAKKYPTIPKRNFSKTHLKSKTFIVENGLRQTITGSRSIQRQYDTESAYFEKKVPLNFF